jgi:hypothetical protein
MPWEDANMVIALVLFGLAALGGLVLAGQRLRGAPQPALPLALAHGAFAAAGLVALIVTVIGGDAPSMARTALIVFLVAAVGGFFLFAQHLQKKALPIPVMVVHALVAVTGFLLLLLGALRLA